jgi:hypothetical protein
MTVRPTWSEKLIATVTLNAVPTIKETCSIIVKDGKRCQRRRVSGDHLCRHHQKRVQFIHARALEIVRSFNVDQRERWHSAEDCLAPYKYSASVNYFSGEELLPWILNKVRSLLDDDRWVVHYEIKRKILMPDQVKIIFKNVKRG